MYNWSFVLYMIDSDQRPDSNRPLFFKSASTNVIISYHSPICTDICYLDVNWLIPKISVCRARIWSLLSNERSEPVTSFIFCRAGWYFSVSIIFTFRWHVYHPQIKHKHWYIYICIFAGKKSHDSKYASPKHSSYR